MNLAESLLKSQGLGDSNQASLTDAGYYKLIIDEFKIITSRVIKLIRLN